MTNYGIRLKLTRQRDFENENAKTQSKMKELRIFT
jgi:hypothetical protein